MQQIVFSPSLYVANNLQTNYHSSQAEQFAHLTTRGLICKL